MNETTAMMVLEVGPYFELTLSILCLLVNIYFAIRFSQSECFSSNLRILLVTSNIITSLCTLLHPILQMISIEWYSIEKGQNYLAAVFVYLSNFTMMVLLMIVNSKFLMLSVERWVAFKNRVDYEQRDGSGARKVLYYYIAIVTILSAIKSIVMFTMSTGSMDERLAWTFQPERCVFLFTPLTFFAGLTWILGVLQFSFLFNYVKKYKYLGQTLSERFQLKQIGQVIEVIIPLLIAYAVAVLYSGVCMLIVLYVYFVEELGTESAEYRVWANAAYYSIPAYSFFSSAYMLWKFRPMRRAMYRDLKSLFGIECWRPHIVHPHNATDEGNVYFDQLRASWGVPKR
ncbi:hypothetical protein M3Y98_00064000 [Aphelenchoides besseyi]|nr:hypothetical protein M3Y98_00064000 [Aphelenchoides besseyi]